MMFIRIIDTVRSVRCAWLGGMSSVSLNAWSKAFKAIYGRSPKKSTDFEIVTAVAGKKTLDDNVVQTNSSIKSRSFVKLKRSAHTCSNLMPLAKKSNCGPYKTERRSDPASVNATLAVNTAAACSTFEHRSVGLYMGRRLRCSAIESPIKVMQQPTVVDSPQKAAPLRASAALLFVDSLLPCETSDPIQDDSSSREHYEACDESAASLKRARWNGDLPLSASRKSGNDPAGQENCDAAGISDHDMDSHRKGRASKMGTSLKKRKTAVIQRRRTSANDSNYVRLNIKKKTFARVPLSAMAKRKKFHRDKFKRRI
uniref:Uncharacterized protein n=1 Tax=Ascaris lumbricoides TaxID=6252 RepID=A0A0M3HZ15_ASCLU